MSAAIEGAPHPTLAAALAFRDRGWRPFPLDHPGLRKCPSQHKITGGVCTAAKDPSQRGKHPAGWWPTMVAARQSDQTLALWFERRGLRNIGIGCKASGLLVLDEDELGALEALAASLGKTLPSTYRVRTGRGWHFYFRAPEQELGNKAGVLKRHHIDVRGGHGDGGYVVAAGSTHHTGVVYTAENPDAEPVEVPDWIVELIEAAPDAELDVSGDTGRVVVPGSGRKTFTASTDEPRRGFSSELRAQYRRRLGDCRTPGFRGFLFAAARDGWRLVNLGLMTEGEMLDDLATVIQRVWGAEPDLEDHTWARVEARSKAVEEPWELLDAYELPRTSTPAGSGASSAASRLQDPVVLRHDGADIADHIVVEPDEPDPAPGELPILDTEVVSSWVPVDLEAAWDGNLTPRKPERLMRDDGVGMFYAGETHSLHGESESGKSWVAQTAVVEALNDGAMVLYVDFESTVTEILPRLRALGMEREQLPQLRYVQPEGPRDAQFAELLTHRYALAVIDGVTASMAVLAAKSNEQDAVTVWHKMLPEPIARWTGAAVVQVDHVSKDKDNRGRFAVGSQAKMSNLSGSAFYVDVAEGLGQGKRGVLRLWVAKDRPGGVRAHAGAMVRDRLQPFARYIHDARDPSRIGTALEPWMGDDAATLELEGEAGPLALPAPRTWRDPDQPPLPGDIVSYAGEGRQAIKDLARLLRVMAVGGDGVSRTDATVELSSVLGPDGKPKYNRMTIHRAWGALRDQSVGIPGSTAGLARLVPAESNGSGNPSGLHWWVAKDGDPAA